MALRVIVKEPDPILREVSRPVPKITPNILKLLDDMAETMYDAQGVGLAAPQIGVLKRVIVLDPADGTGLIEMINPEIVEQSGRVLGAEGCLSIPGINGEVYRHEKIRVKGLNRHGEEVVIDAEDWLARIFQHEIDHLNGILFIDKAETIYRKDQLDEAES